MNIEAPNTVSVTEQCLYLLASMTCSCDVSVLTTLISRVRFDKLPIT